MCKATIFWLLKASVFCSWVQSTMHKNKAGTRSKNVKLQEIHQSDVAQVDANNKASTYSILLIFRSFEIFFVPGNLEEKIPGFFPKSLASKKVI